MIEISIRRCRGPPGGPTEKKYRIRNVKFSSKKCAWQLVDTFSTRSFFSPQNLKLTSEYCTYSSFKCDSQDCSYGWLVWENNLRIGKIYLHYYSIAWLIKMLLAWEKPQSSSYRGSPEMGRVSQSVEERRALLEGNPLLSPVTSFFQRVFSIITYEVLLFSLKYILFLFLRN